jgi:hypothetical protein
MQAKHERRLSSSGAPLGFHHTSHRRGRAPRPCVILKPDPERRCHSEEGAAPKPRIPPPLVRRPKNLADGRAVPAGQEGSAREASRSTGRVVAEGDSSVGALESARGERSRGRLPQNDTGPHALCFPQLGRPFFPGIRWSQPLTRLWPPLITRCRPLVTPGSECVAVRGNLHLHAGPGASPGPASGPSGSRWMVRSGPDHDAGGGRRGGGGRKHPVVPVRLVSNRPARTAPSGKRGDSGSPGPMPFVTRQAALPLITAPRASSPHRTGCTANCGIIYLHRGAPAVRAIRSTIHNAGEVR